MSGRDPIPQPQSYEGVRATNPPDLIISKGPNARNPTVNDHKYRIGTLWNNQLLNTVWMLTSIANSLAVWTELDNSGGSSTFSSLTVTPGPTSITGTTNINTSGAGVTSIGTGGTGQTNIGNTTGNTAITGALGTTTTLTGGTGITATTGNITATTGNFVASAAGQGFVFNSPTASGASPGPVVVNGRTGSATFTGPSIAAAADLTLTITNSAITGASTQISYSLQGATTGSALQIKSVTNSAGSSAIVITNGTGATTSTADISLVFIVLN